MFHPSAPEPQFHSGVVISFNHERGFGKIELFGNHILAPDKTIFVHARDVCGRDLQAHDKVRFRLAESGRRSSGKLSLQAKQVTGGSTPQHQEDGRRTHGKIFSWDPKKGCGHVKEGKTDRILYLHFTRASGQLRETLANAQNTAGGIVNTHIIFTARGSGAFFAENIPGSADTQRTEGATERTDRRDNGDPSLNGGMARGLQNDLNSLKAQNAELREQMDSLRDEMALLRAQNGDLVSGMEKMQAENSDLINNIKTISGDLGRMRIISTNQTAALENLTENHARQTENFRSVSDAMKSMAGSIIQLPDALRNAAISSRPAPSKFLNTMDETDHLGYLTDCFWAVWALLSGMFLFLWGVTFGSTDAQANATRNGQQVKKDCSKVFDKRAVLWLAWASVFHSYYTAITWEEKWSENACEALATTPFACTSRITWRFFGCVWFHLSAAIVGLRMESSGFWAFVFATTLVAWWHYLRVIGGAQPASLV
jgi:cold shock CspA family protein